MSNRKTIMIDGRNLGLEKGTGVATYGRNLSFALHNLGYSVDVLYGNRVSNKLSDLMKEVIFFDDNFTKSSSFLNVLGLAKDIIRFPFGLNASRVPITGNVIYDGFKGRFPYFDHIESSPNIFSKSHSLFKIFRRFHRVSPENTPDLMHWTYPLPLRVPNAPNVYTLHDLVPLRLPYTTLDNKVNYFNIVKQISKSADHIVTVSESAKRDIMNLFGVSDDRITNTYQSVYIPEKYSGKAEDVVQREVEGVFGLGYKNYYIFWGSIEPKKNIGRLIEGYLASGVLSPLVIVGAQAWKSESQLGLLYEDNVKSLTHAGSETRFKRKIYQFSYAPFSLLVSLIKGAKAALFPSLYEGFGLPVIEAMSLGTPVVTSNTSSLPEIAGEGAIFVNPYETSEISQAIRALDCDADLRLHLTAIGKVQAEKFSEEAYAQRLSSIYARFM